MSNLIVLVAAVLITVIVMLSFHTGAFLLIGLTLGGLLGWYMKPIPQTPGLPEGTVAVNEKEIYDMLIEHGFTMFKGAMEVAEETRQQYGVVPNVVRIQKHSGDHLVAGIYIKAQGQDKLIHLYKVQETIEEIKRDTNTHQEKRNGKHSAAEKRDQPARSGQSDGAHGKQRVGNHR
jgi:hypothetical protein